MENAIELLEEAMTLLSRNVDDRRVREAIGHIEDALDALGA